MDRVTAASSMCQPSLHALHTEATAAAVRDRATPQLNVLFIACIRRTSINLCVCVGQLLSMKNADSL